MVSEVNPTVCGLLSGASIYTVPTPLRERRGREKHAGWAEAASDRISDFVCSSKPSGEFPQKGPKFPVDIQQYLSYEEKQRINSFRNP